MREGKERIISENTVKRWVRDYLTQLEDCFFFMPKSGPFGRSGIPDFILCLNGRFVAIETKRPGGKLTDLQINVGEEIEETGGIVFVISNRQQFEDFKQWVSRYISCHESTPN